MVDYQVSFNDLFGFTTGMPINVTTGKTNVFKSIRQQKTNDA